MWFGNGRSDGSRDGAGSWNWGSGVILGANVGRPIVTNRDLVALWLLPKSLWDF